MAGGWRRIPRTGATRTHALHGQVRRSEPTRRDADDDHLEEGVLRNRVEHCARRASGCHSTRGLLSRLARIAHPSGETRRGRDSRLTIARGAAEPGAAADGGGMIRFWDFQLSGAPPLLSLVVSRAA